jgi:hypothetical protein
MKKWERQHWLSEIDLRRISCCIQNMRMLCDSTFLFDKTSRHSPKLDEFREIIRELAIEEDRKVVVFSEYERMTRLAGEELAKLGIGFVSLHGGVPARKRGALMETFRHDPNCKVFLSTDAGGVGLNLQAASAVINFEPPWNPARLEQRIGRVHRLGQSRPVQVIHFLTTGSIEERVWETLRLKQSLFAGVFDSPAAEVSFAALGKKSVLQAVKEVFADQPGRPKPILEPPQPVPVPAGAQPPAHPAVALPAAAKAGIDASKAPAVAAEQTDGHERGNFEEAAAGLIDAGVRFLESLGSHLGARVSQPHLDDPVQRLISPLIQTNPQTNRPVLAIPLPDSVGRERLVAALSGLLAGLASGSHE